MDAITYTKARKNFTAIMNKVCEDHSPIIITRQKENPVVMLSLEDYNAIEETLYLMKTSKNASRLIRSIAEVENKNISQKSLIEEK